MTDTLKFELNEAVLINENCSHVDCVGKKGVIDDIDSETELPYSVDLGDIQRWHTKFCLTKLQDKPMENTNIKVGDDVRVLSKNHHHNQTGKVFGVRGNVGQIYDIEFPDYYQGAYSRENIEKITQESEQVKPEPGKPYNLYNLGKPYSNAPYTYICDKRNFGIVNDNPLIFCDKYGMAAAFPLKILEEIKKHSEPFKHTFEADIYYCEIHYPDTVIADYIENADVCCKLISAEITIIEKSK